MADITTMRRLFLLADDAKEVGEYDIANIVFHYCWEQYEAGRPVQDDDEWGNLRVCGQDSEFLRGWVESNLNDLEYETEAEGHDGYGWPESYFDLDVLELLHPQGELIDPGQYMCIPSPLTGDRARHNVPRVPRGEHKRRQHQPGKEEVESLWRELVTMLGVACLPKPIEGGGGYASKHD